MPIPHQIDRETARRVIRKARKLTAMLQGTMGLEAQGLDRKSLRAMFKKTRSELLAASR